MEETQPKLRRIPSMFRTSFGSCSSRALSDIINKSVAVPLLRPFPSICRPSAATDTYSSAPTDPVTVSDILKGRICPSAPPPATPPRHLFQTRTTNKVETEQPDWFSSDDEIKEAEEDNEVDTMFSSRSLSSDSSYMSYLRRGGIMEQPRVVDIKDSFAVVKKSSDPYGDFRRSMVEMIVEKEMFGAEEMERLLQCFLSLNSRHHHGVIVEVFSEIWEALFPHWS